MNKTSSPLISIIVPVYNVEEYLSYCIESILQQTYRNLEILLIDDGSTDTSLQICRDFESKDSRCKVYHHENQGSAYTRNRGLKIAKGDYVSFIDSDDYVDKHFIETLFTNIMKGPYDFSMIDYQHTYNHEFKIENYANKIEAFSQRELFNYLYGRFSKGLDFSDDTLFLMVTNKLYKKQILEDLSFPPYKLSEDLYFNNLVFLRVKGAIFIKEKLYYYFQRTDSISHVINRNYIDGLQAYWDSLNQIPLEKKEFRAASLSKLYKIILRTKYRMKNIPNKKGIDDIIKTIQKQTMKEMRLSKFIPFHMKLFFILCCQFPFLYNWFVYLCELRVKI